MSAEEEGCKTEDELNADDLQLESRFCSLIGNRLGFVNVWRKKMCCSLNFLNEL